MVSIIGVDPGIRNTGLIEIKLDASSNTVTSRALALEGFSGEKVDAFIAEADNPVRVAVEKYTDRATNFNQNAPMREAESWFTRKRPYTVTLLSNMGIKKVVTQPLMELLELWTYPENKTFHQDIRSAARIALFDALRQDDLNRIITSIVAQRLGSKTHQ